jgi:hypothetical protein
MPSGSTGIQISALPPFTGFALSANTQIPMNVSGVTRRLTSNQIVSGASSVFFYNVKTLVASATAGVNDDIIELDTLGAAVAVTFPSAAPIGKRMAAIWITGANTASVVGAGGFNVVDFDGVVKSSITLSALNTAATYVKGSINWQLI